MDFQNTRKSLRILELSNPKKADQINLIFKSEKIN